MAEIGKSFKFKGLGRKVRRVTSHCEIYQTVKHANCSYVTGVSSHLISRPGELCAIDFFGALTVRRADVRYSVFCMEVSFRFIKFYPLRPAKTKSCLNKISGHDISRVRHPKCIFSNNETQSDVWLTVHSNSVWIRKSN